MENGGRLIIVVPCFNEEEVLQDTNRQLCMIAEKLEKDGKIDSCRILYVDDGSKDNTWKIIRELCSCGDALCKNGMQRVCGIKLAHNVGHQRALWAGLNEACPKCDAVISIDADLQDDENCIADMVDKFHNGADIVYGVRKERSTDTVFKRVTAQAFYRFMQAMGGDIVYNHADYRLMSRRSLEALLEYPERNLFLRGMVRLVGFNTAEVYYDRKERTAGESKYPLSKMINFAIDGITSFSVKPLRIIVTLGFVFILISIIAIVYGLISYIDGNAVEGWTSLIVSIWFIGGCILVGLGIVGEYIGKIYTEVKHRPLFTKEETINI